MSHFTKLLLAGALSYGAGFSVPALQAASETLVDLELILAVDTSSSVSAEEFELQMHGLADAFRNPLVGAAIQAMGDRGAAVTLIQWAENRKQVRAIDWQIVRNEAEAATFAAEIERTDRHMVGGGTAIGSLIQFGMKELARNAYSGKRKVIDISGDGRTNQGPYPSNYREKATAAGVTVNGLAILNEDPNVDRYYRSHVIAGTGAFVMSATTYEDFSDAMLEKLLKEIAGSPIARLRPPRQQPIPEAKLSQSLAPGLPGEEQLAQESRPQDRPITSRGE